MAISSNLCRIQDSTEHGRVLVATQDLKPGQHGLLVFREPALLTVPTTRTPEDESGKVPEILAPGPQLWTDWFYFQKQPEDVKSKILDLYVEMDCAPAVVMRQYLERHYKDYIQVKEEEEKAQDHVDNDEKVLLVLDKEDESILNNIEEFIRFTMVIRFNTVELIPPSPDGSGPGYDYGHGLFENACKMSHSCRPNCVWKTTQDGKAKEIRAIRSIKEGEELTVDYVGNVLQAIPERRQELLMTKGFLCNCDRCASESGDDTRRFPCSHRLTAGCMGVHFLHQPLLSKDPILLKCTQCGVKPSDSYTIRALNQEKELKTELDELDEVADEVGIENVSDRIEQLQPPHDLHRLAEKCFGLQGELYSRLGDHESSAQAYAKQINCRIAILGEDFKSQQTAFLCERLGDELCHVNVAEAEEAYKRSVRALQLMRGGVQDDPYCKCAVNKLLDVQCRLTSRQEEELPHQEDLKGISKAPPGCCFLPTENSTGDCPPCVLCGNPGNSSLSSVGRDEVVYFCCDDHKRLYTSFVHKHHDLSSSPIQYDGEFKYDS